MEPNKHIIKIGTSIHNGLLKYGYEHLYLNDWDLSGGCAIAAYFMTKTIRQRLGLNAKFCAHENHAWVRCENYFYDPTAIQFDKNLPKVFAFPTSKLKDINFTYYDIYFRYFNEYKMTITAINVEWPFSQRPNTVKAIWKSNTKVEFIKK